jgi:glucose/mannose transport system permease protein
MATDSSDTSVFDVSNLSEMGYSRVLLYATVFALVVLYLIPIETGLVTSLKSSPLGSLPYLPPAPSGFSLVHWNNAFNQLVSGLINSFILAIPATVLSAFIGSVAAYGLTNLSWRRKTLILTLFIAGIFIPYQAVLIPLSKFWAVYFPIHKQFGTYGQLLELIISHVAYGIPITVLLFRTYYKDIPTEMLEAAELDGASAFGIYRRIILPLSGPMFAVTLIYQFTQVWNDLLFALVVMGPGPGAPVTIPLAQLGASLSNVGFGIRMAGAFIAAFPTLLVYVMFGDQFAEGVAT